MRSGLYNWLCSISVKKHSYACSLSSVGTGGDARLWVGL